MSFFVKSLDGRDSDSRSAALVYLTTGVLLTAVFVTGGVGAANNVDIATKTTSSSTKVEVDRMAGIKARVRKTYPTVAQLSIQEYAHSSDNRLLVDVRARPEFEVSRIPGAVHIDDPDELLAYAKANPDKELVLYCSVGMRSSKAAAGLQAQGISQVMNLEGSIFQWSNDRRPLEDGAGPTQKVHPYNAFWGWRYLER